MGDQLIAWEQITRVGQSVDLFLLTLDDGLEDEAELRRKLAPFCRGITVLHGARRWQRAWRSLYTATPALVTLFRSAALQESIRDRVDTVAPDLIHVQSIHMAEYFRALRLPKVLDMVDVMSVNMTRRARLLPFPRRCVYEREARLLRRYEAEVMRAYQATLAVSQADAAAHPQAGIRVNPNGTRITAEQLAPYLGRARELALVFHGNMSYAPNADAARLLCRELMRPLRERYPTLRLYVVGFDPPPAVRALHDGSSVVVTGAVDDIAEYLTRCTIGVYPLRLGSGMQNKILDALACGLPCVVSPLALQGIAHARPGVHALVADEPGAWSRLIAQLLEDEPLRLRLGQQGQEMVRAHYTWERNIACLLEVWRAAAGIGTP